MNKIVNYINKNKIIIALFILSILIIVPILLNNLYNNPVADDFTLMNGFNKELNGKDLNIISFFRTSIKRTINLYYSWQGTYFSHFLGNFNPLLISYKAYKIAMGCVQLFYMFSVMFLFYTLSKIKNFFNFKQAMILGLVYLLYSILFMYSTAEGLYWFGGSIVYLIPYSLSMIFSGVLILYEIKHKKLLYFLLMLLAVCLGGGSYVTGLFLSFLLFVITILKFIYKKPDKYKYLILLIIFGVAFSFNVLCPGNFIRMENFVENTIPRALLMAIPLSLNMILDILFKTLIIPILLLCIPMFIIVAKKLKYKFKFPILTPIVFLIMFILFFVPCTYAYGTFYQEVRVQNIQFFYFTLMLFLSIFNAVGYLVQKEDKAITFINSNYKIFNYFIIIILFSFIAAIGVQTFNNKIIIDEKMQGISNDYNACMNNIFTKLTESTTNVVEIENCTRYPKSLHHYIFTQDSWITYDMGIYFNKKIIIK
jgi:hypothetical protein